VADIYARIATLKFDCEVEDTAHATMEFASGALGHVEVAWTATGYHEGFWINGTEGSLECDSRNGTTVLIHRFRSDRAPLGNSSDVARYELNTHSPHTNHVMNFLAAIEGRRDVVCTGQDGLEAVRLVLAAYESAERGGPVAL
jgi:predicted dehydrogenase